MTNNEAERVKRERDERAEDLRRVPLQPIDRSKWPINVRPISLTEADGLGIDPDGRLYWNGKPVEIIRQRLDLTWVQTGVAIAVALFTLIAAVATLWQAWTAYQDWACKAQLPGALKCPPEHMRIWGE